MAIPDQESLAKIIAMVTESVTKELCKSSSSFTMVGDEDIKMMSHFTMLQTRLKEYNGEICFSKYVQKYGPELEEVEELTSKLHRILLANIQVMQDTPPGYWNILHGLPDSVQKQEIEKKIARGKISSFKEILEYLKKHEDEEMVKVNKVEVKSQIINKKVFEKKKERKCYVCGACDHIKPQCPSLSEVYTKRCDNCQLFGHLAIVCKKVHHNNKNLQYKVLFLSSTCNENFYEYLSFNKVKIKFLVDSGADANFIRVLSYANEVIDILGKWKTYHGEFLVVRNGFDNLLGKEWMKKNSYQFKYVNQLAKEKPMSEIMASKHVELFKDELGTIKGQQIHLKVKENVKPIYCEARRVPFSRMEPVKKCLEQMVQKGVLIPVDNPEWSAPIVVVSKRVGEDASTEEKLNAIRICPDFSTGLNEVLEEERITTRTMEELLALCPKGKHWTVVDVRDAFHSFEIAPDSRKYVSISTPFGHYQYTRMAFGLKVAPIVFQKFMNDLLAPVKTASAWQDDILIVNDNYEDHLRDVDAVLTLMENVGLKLKLTKCAFNKNEVPYLGYILSNKGKRLDPNRYKDLLNMKSPVNQTQLHSFIGMLAYYGNYIPNLHLHKPVLSCLLKKGCPFKWGVKEETAFKAIKDSLVIEALEHYSFELPLVLMTDSSEYGIGSSLNHRMSNGDLKPIAFYAKTLTDTEVNYQICEKEGLAVVLSIERFHQYLSGRKFTLMTDNRGLECIFKTSKGMSKVQAKRIARWRLQLLEYDFDVQLTKSASMGPADSLSRLIMAEKENLNDDEIMVARIKNNKQVELQLNLLSIRNESSIDELIKEIKVCMDAGSWPKRTNSLIRFYKKYRTMIEEVDGVLYINGRILLPNNLRSKALQEAHEGHLGITNMSRKLRIKYIWHGLDTDVKNFVRLCIACQNISNCHSVPDEDWPKTQRPMQRIHVDHFYFEGKPYLLLKDVYSGWIEVTSVKSLHTNVTIQWFNLIFRRLGFPQCLVTDQAPVFNSCEIEQYCRDVGIVKMTSHAYHAASNGTAERAVQHVKNILKKGKIDNVENLESYLNNCLIEYHELPKDNGRTPAQDMLNRDLRTNETVYEHPDHTKDNPFCNVVNIWYYDVITKTWIPGTIEKLIGSRGARVVVENGTKSKDVHVTHLRQRFINVENCFPFSNAEDEEDEPQKVETSSLFEEKCIQVESSSEEKAFDVITKVEDDKIEEENLRIGLESEISLPSLSDIDDSKENSDYTYSPSEEVSE
uniref:RNA-directed DNA polymerase n=1 Tax=Strongyloides papillosus TaxID=174720 RepID=A0A0N5B5L5_STREA